jgi:hypothetical protein
MITSLNNSLILLRIRSLDVQLCYSDLTHVRLRQCPQRTFNGASPSRGQMRLGPNTIDRDPLARPLIHLLYCDRYFGPDFIVKTVVVDVEFCVRICGARGAEGNADEVFAEDRTEDRGPEGAVVGEDLVDDVLCIPSESTLSHRTLGGSYEPMTLCGPYSVPRE